MALSKKLEAVRNNVQKKKKAKKRFKQKRKGKKRASDRRVRKNDPEGLLEGARATARQTSLLANEVGFSRDNAAKVSGALGSSTDLTDSSGQDADDILSAMDDGLGGGLDEGGFDATVDLDGGAGYDDDLGMGVDFSGDFETGADDLGKGVNFGGSSGGSNAIDDDLDPLF